MINVRLAGDHLYGKWLYTWSSLVMFLMMCYFVLSFFFNGMSWMRSGTELSHFLRIFLHTLVYSRTTTIIQNYNLGLILDFKVMEWTWKLLTHTYTEKRRKLYTPMAYFVCQGYNYLPLSVCLSISVFPTKFYQCNKVLSLQPIQVSSDSLYGKVKYRKMLEHKVSWTVLKIFTKNVKMMTLG